MASSIKIQKHTKAELDQFQAEILVKYKRKLTQQELIELFLRIGKENIHNHFSQIEIEDKRESLREMLKNSSSWGIVTHEDMVNEVLYGVTKS